MAGLVKIKTDNYKWAVTPEWEKFLREKLLGVLENKHTSPAGAEMIKSNRARTVFYFPPALTGSVGLFLKKYNVRTSVEALQYALFPNKAKREWRCLNVFRERGISAAEPAFIGLPRALATRRPSYLGVVEVPDVKFPNQVLEDRETDRAKFIGELARWTRSVLDAGVIHRDFQPGNILVQASHGAWKFHLIDLHAAWPGKRTEKGTARSLAKLLGDLSPWLDAADTAAFLESFSGSKHDSEKIAPYVEAEILRQRKRVLRKRTERALVDSSSFAVQWIGTWKIYRRREVTLPDVFRVLERGADTVHEADETVKVHIKKIGGIGLIQNLKDVFQMPRGRRAFMAFNGFKVRGLPAPEAFALGESRPSGLLRESFLITKKIEDAVNFQSAIHAYFIAPRLEGLEAERVLKNRFIGSVARSVALLHRNGIYNRDLKGENLLIREKNGTFEVYFVDLDAVRFMDSIDIGRAGWNLAQLGASVPYCVGRREFIRFFAIYAKYSPFHSRRKELIRMAAKMLEKRKAGWLALYWKERNRAEGRAAS